MKRLKVDLNHQEMIDYLERLRKEGFVQLVGFGEYEWVETNAEARLIREGITVNVPAKKSSDTMNFTAAVDLLNRGGEVRRCIWPKGVRVFKRRHPPYDVVKVDAFRPLFENPWFPGVHDVEATDWEKYEEGEIK